MKIKTEQLRRIIREETENLMEDARGMRDAADHASYVAAYLRSMTKHMKQLVKTLENPSIDSDEITAKQARDIFKHLRGAINEYADALTKLSQRAEEKKSLYLRQRGRDRENDDILRRSR